MANTEVKPETEGKPENVKNAEEKKADGNGYFKDANYLRALFCYSEAIEILEGDGDNLSVVSDDTADTSDTNNLSPAATKLLIICNSNRANCHLKLENFGSAISDTTKCVELDSTFVKGYYRRGCAYSFLGKFKEAKGDFTNVVKLSPQDKDARYKLKECTKELKAAAFLRAIATEATKPLSETIDLSTMTRDSSYEGPVFSEPVTAEFLASLSAWQKEQKCLDRLSAYTLCMAVIKFLQTEKTVCRVDVPPNTEFTVCGDVHGQYYDLLNIFEKNGPPSETNPYLFNGDFVDRGSFSVECILLLFSYKVAYPKHFFLSRGNHETKAMNKLYGFSGEVTTKFDERLYELFSEAFCHLPLAHVIGGQIFVVHGGLFSRDDVQLDELTKIDRCREPPDAGLMVEMLWSDPQPMLGRAPSKRGVGLTFGPDVTRNFLRANGLKMVVRSHEMKEKGYEVEHGGELCTIFSAPNYCDQMGNQGAYIRFKADGTGDLTPNYESFDAVPHPEVRPMQYANKALFGNM